MSRTSASFPRCFYDGLKFHRYVPGFVIQGGDPNTRDMSAPTSPLVLRAPTACPVPVAPATASRASLPPIRATAMSMVPLPWHAPWTPIPRFAVLLLPGRQHNLDSGYTVFGTTVEGLDVISQLRAGDEIVHVEIVHE